MASANINIRTDSELKSKAQAILDDLGLDMSTAINIFLKQVVYQEAIPFEISKDNAKIDKNEKSEKELEEIRQRRLAALGSMKGKIWISEDFNDPIEDMKEYME